MYPTIYDMDERFDYGGIIERMEKLDEEIQNERTKEEADNEKIFNLMYSKFIQGMKLNTGYVNLWGK